MRLLERFPFTTHHHHHHHDSNHHHSATDEGSPPARGAEAEASSVYPLTCSGSTGTISSRRRFGFRRSGTDETIALSHRRVRFQLDHVPWHDTPSYSSQEAEATWYNRQELNDMKMNCARHVVDYLREHRDDASDELEKAIETCQHVAHDEAPVATQQQLLQVLSPVVGVLHLCCKSFAVAIRERRRTILLDVQQAQRRCKRQWSHSGGIGRSSSTDTDLCRAFLVCRASEQTSLPCARLAGWLAHAVAL